MGHPGITKIFVASSWRTRRAYLEALGHPGYLGLLGTIGCTIARTKKKSVQLCSPKAHSPFPDRLRLPYPDEEILSGYQEDVSFIRDGFTSWVKADFETLLERHAVDIRKALAEFREAPARNMIFLIKSIVSKATCLTAHLSRKGTASRSGTQDLDWEEELSRSKLQGNGMFSPCKKRLSMLTTGFSRTGST